MLMEKIKEKWASLTGKQKKISVWIAVIIIVIIIGISVPVDKKDEVVSSPSASETEAPKRKITPTKKVTPVPTTPASTAPTVGPLAETPEERINWFWDRRGDGARSFSNVCDTNYDETAWYCHATALESPNKNVYQIQLDVIKGKRGTYDKVYADKLADQTIAGICTLMNYGDKPLDDTFIEVDGLNGATPIKQQTCKTYEQLKG